MSDGRDAPPGRAALLTHELMRRGLRGAKRLVRPWWMHRLRQRNLASCEPVVADGGPVVSLTTYEPRWERVFYTIESIGAGRLRPSRLVLWVAEPLLRQGVPDSLPPGRARPGTAWLRGPGPAQEVLPGGLRSRTHAAAGDGR